jgi:hypothetical protein
MNTHTIDITLEDYFRAHYGRAVDFSLRIDYNPDNSIRFYIHPDRMNGDTLDFKVDGNSVECVTKKVMQ